MRTTAGRHHRAATRSLLYNAAHGCGESVAAGHAGVPYFR